MTTPAAPYVFAFNGWLFGGPGQGVQILSVTGLEDLPAIRSQDENRGYQDGMLTGRDFLDARTITVELQVMNDANNPMQTYLAELKQNLVPQQAGVGTLQFYLPNRSVQRVYGRVRRRALKIDPEYVYGRAIAVVEFFCPDPRIYADTATTATAAAAAGSVRRYDRTYDLVYSGVPGATSTVTLTNGGTWPVWPTYSISGECTAPFITNITTGQYLSFPSLTMTASDSLVVDSDFRTVVFNGAAARNLVGVGSSWWPLEPGVATGINFSSSSGNPNCLVSFRNGYI